MGIAVQILATIAIFTLTLNNANRSRITAGSTVTVDKLKALSNTVVRFGTSPDPCDIKPMKV